MLTLQNLRWCGKQLLSAFLQILQHNLRSGWTRAFGPRNSARYFGLGLTGVMSHWHLYYNFWPNKMHFHPGCFMRFPATLQSDVIMSAMMFQITGVIVYSTLCSGADQRKHQRSASVAFVKRIHRWPVNSPHKEPVKRKMFPFDDVIMISAAYMCR